MCVYAKSTEISKDPQLSMCFCSINDDQSVSQRQTLVLTLSLTDTYATHTQWIKSKGQVRERERTILLNGRTLEGSESQLCTVRLLLRLFSNKRKRSCYEDVCAPLFNRSKPNQPVSRSMVVVLEGESSKKRGRQSRRENPLPTRISLLFFILFWLRHQMSSFAFLPASADDVAFSPPTVPLPRTHTHIHSQIYKRDRQTHTLNYKCVRLLFIFFLLLFIHFCLQHCLGETLSPPLSVLC